MLYKYRNAVSLRDEIGICPNIEVEIDVMDKSPFFRRPHYVREEDKAHINKEMKWLSYMGILKGFSAYSSSIILISRKLTKDKRVVTDFRHLNIRIAANNLVYPLVRNTYFFVLGSSKCEVLSVLDLKDAFHSLRL